MSTIDLILTITTCITVAITLFFIIKKDIDKHLPVEKIIEDVVDDLPKVLETVEQHDLSNAVQTMSETIH